MNRPINPPTKRPIDLATNVELCMFVVFFLRLFSTKFYAVSAKLEADKCVLQTCRQQQKFEDILPKNMCPGAFWDYFVSNQEAHVPVNSRQIFFPKIRTCPVWLRIAAAGPGSGWKQPVLGYVYYRLLGIRELQTFWNTCTVTDWWSYEYHTLHTLYICVLQTSVKFTSNWRKFNPELIRWPSASDHLSFEHPKNTNPIFWSSAGTWTPKIGLENDHITASTLFTLLIVIVFGTTWSTYLKLQCVKKHDIISNTNTNGRWMVAWKNRRSLWSSNSCLAGVDGCRRPERTNWDSTFRKVAETI